MLVFLRVLEYYAGILFLTTNRIGDFDEAFASRIHMSLHYPPLNELSTTKVFQLNLALIKARYKEAGRKIKIDELEILQIIGTYWREHEKARWNGRQIRNACQTALALAEFDAQPAGSKYDLQVRSDAKVHLKIQHLQIVSNAYLGFMEYLKAVYGTDSDTHAKESGIRALETAIAALKAGKTPGGSERGGTQRENPLRIFKLKNAALASQQGMPGPSMAEQVSHLQPQPPPQHREAPQMPAQPGLFGQGRDIAVPQGNDGQFSAPSRGYAPNVAASNFRQPAFADTAQRQPHQSLGHHSSGPPQQGAYSLSTDISGSAEYASMSAYPPRGDPGVGRGQLHNESYNPVADPRPGSQPGQNPEFGHADYEQRQPSGRGGYM